MTMLTLNLTIIILRFIFAARPDPSIHFEDETLRMSGRKEIHFSPLALSVLRSKMYRRVRDCIFVGIFLCTSSCIYPFSYDSAVYKAQKGNWQDAHVALNSIITDNPDNADIMYDAGVAAYNVGNKCQAGICFTRAAECSSDKNVCFRAHFNAGNTYVDEKKLEDAITEFDKALVIEPDNEYAQHNRDRVAEMLKQQEQKNKDDQKNDKQEQDKQEQEDKQNQENQQDQNKQNQENENNQNQDKQEQDQNGNDQKSSDGNDKQNNGKKEQQKNSGNHEQRDSNDELKKKPHNAQNADDTKQGEKHGTTPEQQTVNDDKSNVSPQDGQQAITDPWLLKVLQNQELHDKAINKQLMEAKIRQHGGKYGQNCW
jgi:Ca-activated chloride channel homolog